MIIRTRLHALRAGWFAHWAAIARAERRGGVHSYPLHLAIVIERESGPIGIDSEHPFPLGVSDAQADRSAMVLPGERGDVLKHDRTGVFDGVLLDRLFGRRAQAHFAAPVRFHVGCNRRPLRHGACLFAQGFVLLIESV